MLHCGIELFHPTGSRWLCKVYLFNHVFQPLPLNDSVARNILLGMFHCTHSAVMPGLLVYLSISALSFDCAVLPRSPCWRKEGNKADFSRY